MKTFQFSYLTAKNIVTVDDVNNIHIKTGPFKINFNINDVRYIFIKKYDDYSEFIIRYTRKTGKEKKKKLLFENIGESADEAKAFADFLAENKRGIDLRELDDKTAMNTIGAKSSAVMAIWIVVILLFGGTSLFFTPTITHFFDNGHTDITAQELISGKDITSRNITVQGVILNAGMWEKTTSTQNGSTTTIIKNFYPLVPDTWEEGDAIHILVETGDLNQSQIDSMALQLSFSGVLRNIWWEGPAKDNLQFLVDEYGLTMADDVMLVEMSDNIMDKFGFYMYLLVLLILCLVLFFVIRKTKK